MKILPLFATSIVAIGAVGCGETTTKTQTQQPKQVQQVQQVQQPKQVDTFSVKSDKGYTYTFTKENVTSRIENIGKGNNHIEEEWIMIDGMDQYYVRSNGTVTDLAGNVHHFSQEYHCKTDGYFKTGRKVVYDNVTLNYKVQKQVGTYRAREFDQSDSRWGKYKYVQKPEYAWVPETKTYKTLSYEDFSNLEGKYGSSNVTGTKRSVFTNKNVWVDEKYPNEYNVVCLAAKHFNLI